MVRVLSGLHGAIIKLRNTLFDKNILKSYATPPLVISVGNIEAGGTGKTPFTIGLASELIKRGHKVAIVTRGYRGQLKGAHIVSAHHTAAEVGDEPLLMARYAPVIKSPDRVEGAWLAHEQLGSEIVILDDGFQHRRIRRDLDIVLISKDNNHMIPRGSLREPASGLERADFIVHTKESQGSPRAEQRPSHFVDIHGASQSLDTIKGKRVLAFCGIAKPNPFFKSLRALGAEVEELVFGDHHELSEKELKRIQHADADYVIMTEKDMIKLKETPANWLALAIRMDVPNEIIEEIENLARHIS